MRYLVRFKTERLTNVENVAEDQASSSRQEVLQEYRSTDVGESGNTEEMREAFDRLSGILERLTRT